MRRADVLRQHGVLYPRTGRLDTLGGGHHNIAWQVSRDGRFVYNLGDIAKLVDEINAFPGNAVISSEDFESILHDRKKIDDFVNQLNGCAAQINFVVYLRNQLSYCQSIFLENLGQHVGEEFRQYVDDVTSYGFMRVKEWAFQFDYLAMLNSLSLGTARLIVRNFHDLTKKSSIADFLQLIGLDDKPFQDRIDHRANERQSSIEAMRSFCVNRLNRPLGEREIVNLSIINHQIDKQKLVNLSSTKTKFQEIFAEGNAQICRQFDLSLKGLDLSSPTTEGGVSYEGLFSFELQCTMMTMRNQIIAGQRAEAERSAAAFVSAATI